MRPQDVADIEGVVQSVSSLDLDRVRRTLAQLSADLEEEHLAERDRILEAHGRRAPGG